MELLAREIGLALIISLLFLGLYGVASPSMPFGILWTGLIAGFVFVLVQGRRKRVTFLTRATSSAISLVLAGYFLSAAAYLLAPLKPSPHLAVLIPMHLFLAHRLLRTDLRLWSWYGSRIPGESGSRQ